MDVIITERKLAATLTLPSENREGCPIVLFFHGWAGHRHEVGGLFAQISDHLAQQEKIASLRFDFWGCGESSPEMLAEMTIATMLQDAKAVLAYLKEHYPTSPIGLCGMSLGAAIMALLMKESGDDTVFESVVAIVPVLNLSQDFGYYHQLLLDTVNTLPDTHNEIIHYDATWKTIPVRPEFIRQFKNFDPQIRDSWTSFQGSCLAMGADLDFSGENLGLLKNWLVNAKAYQPQLLKKTDHLLNAFGPEDSRMPEVVKQVGEWFAHTIELCFLRGFPP